MSACCDLSLPEKTKNKLLRPCNPYRCCCAVLRVIFLIYILFISLATVDITVKKHTLSVAPSAIINGKLNIENTDNFGDMIHTDRSNWRYRPTGEV